MKITHSEGGFGSCGTVALLEILDYFNKHKEAPEVDRSQQYQLYGDKIKLFQEGRWPIEYIEPIEIGDCMSVQWKDYRKLPFWYLNEFVNRYFLPAFNIRVRKEYFMDKYDINLQNTVSVFYRGNDKEKETETPSYDAFINKCKEIMIRRPEVKFLIQPDETQFLRAFTAVFPNTIHITENDHVDKNGSHAVFHTIPQVKRREHVKNFFASLLIHAICSEVVTHSGNIGLWLALYRGRPGGIHQIFKGKWY
jgi:hypothetical protein